MGLNCTVGDIDVQTFFLCGESAGTYTHIAQATDLDPRFDGQGSQSMDDLVLSTARTYTFLLRHRVLRLLEARPHAAEGLREGY